MYKRVAYDLEFCKECGHPFTPRRKDSRFCCKACKQRNYFQAYYKKNKPHINAVSRAWYRKQKEQKSLWKKISSKFLL